MKSKNGSSRDHVGKRFFVYKIDYGCYIDLVFTKRYPRDLDFASTQSLPVADHDEALLTGEIGADFKSGLIEVPVDDKRSYRSAVLDLTKFYSSLALLPSQRDHGKPEQLTLL